MLVLAGAFEILVSHRPPLSEQRELDLPRGGYAVAVRKDLAACFSLGRAKDAAIAALARPTQALLQQESPLLLTRPALLAFFIS